MNRAIGSRLFTGNKWKIQTFIYGSCTAFALQTAKAHSEGKHVDPGLVEEGYPNFSWEDVQSHNTVDKRIWVTYKDGVYDVTDFVSAHPGQEKILMAAGNMIDGFWKFYGMHHTQEIYSMLEKLRIGNLSEEDRGKWKNAPSPYSEDPSRDIRLLVHSQAPFIAETPNEILADSYYTPNSLFYVRNHNPVPVVDPEFYELTIHGLGIKNGEENNKFNKNKGDDGHGDDGDDDDDDDNEITLTLEEIQSFPKFEVDSVLQCGGNRRGHLAEAGAIKGSKWKIGAICNAKWGGARLVDVLEKYGLDEELAIKLGAQHVHFEGMDWGADEPYGASIPIERALDPRKDVILAYEMNGEILPRDHGYPIRVIAPGVVGARNVKWVSRIEISPQEYEGHYQRKAYKTFSPSQDWSDLDWSKFEAIQECPVQSGITRPSPNDMIYRGSKSVKVSGIAYSGGGSGVIRVDVSADGGKTWKHADLQKPNQRRYRQYAWTLWECELPLTGEEFEINLICKAVDSQHNVQPENIEGIFNLRGYMGNHWHRRNIKLEEAPPPRRGWFS